MGIYLNVIKYDDYRKNACLYASNHLADLCLAPLRGALNFCGKQPRVFLYTPCELTWREESDWKFRGIRPAEKRMFSEQIEWTSSHLSLCKKITVCALLILGAILFTPLGLFCKAIVLLCDSDLRNLYKKLRCSLAYCEQNLRDCALPKEKQVNLPKEIVLHHIVPYLNDAKDVMALSRVSKAWWRFSHTTIHSKYAPFFSIRLTLPCTLNQHMRNLFLGPCGNFASFSLLFEDFSSEQEKYVKSPVHFPGYPELIPLLGENFWRRIPIAHRIESNHAFSRKEEERLQGNIQFETPYNDFVSHVVLNTIHHWCSENSHSHFKTLPSVFRLHVKGSFNSYSRATYSGEYNVHPYKYDCEVFIIKYTFVHCESPMDGNRVPEERQNFKFQHEYLLLKNYRDNWHCIDSRALKALVERRRDVLDHIDRFPPLFSYPPDFRGNRIPLCLNETRWRRGYSCDSTLEPIPFATHPEQLNHLRDFMRGNLIFFRTQPQLEPQAFVKLGHCSL